MPFYCGKRSAGICVVLGPRQSRLPHGTRPAHISRACTDVASLIRDAVHLGGAHKPGATYSSHGAPSTYSSGRKGVSAHWGWAGEKVTPPVVSGTCRLTGHGRSHLAGVHRLGVTYP